MKKFLALFLVLAMMLSVALVACSDTTTTSGNNNNDVEDNDDDDLGFVSKDTNNDDETGDDTDDKGNTNIDTDWNTVAYTIYAMCSINIRTEPSAKSATHGTVTAKTALNATAKSTDEDDCWFKISYDGSTYYVDADYVTTNLKEATFNNLEESAQFELTIKAPADSSNKNQVKLRKLPTFDAEFTFETVTNEDTTNNKMKVVGMNESGNWYIVEYKNETYYLAVTSSTKPYLEGLPSAGGSDGPVGG